MMLLLRDGAFGMPDMINTEERIAPAISRRKRDGVVSCTTQAVNHPRRAWQSNDNFVHASRQLVTTFRYKCLAETVI